MNDDLDDYPDSQGGRANFNGRKFENLIAAALRALGYALVPAKNLADLLARKSGLFTELGIFAQRCQIPFEAPCHRRKNRSAEVDCAVHTIAGESILLSCKSQKVNGSAEEKLEFEIRNLCTRTHLGADPGRQRPYYVVPFHTTPNDLGRSRTADCWPQQNLPLPLHRILRPRTLTKKDSPMPATDTLERTNAAPTAHHDAELVPIATAQTRALTPPQSWQTQLAGKQALATALVAAIRACESVPHDANVAFGKVAYAYTSSEAIFREARTALAANGLAVIPIEQSVNGSERTGPDRFELISKRLLMHSSGESILCTSAWPIIPENGRPLDKATAAADTLSLAYFLRDLLQLPRVDPADEVARRNDTARAAAPAPKKEKAAKPPLPANGVELRDRVEARDANLARAGRIREGDLIGHVSAALAKGGYDPSLALAAGPALDCALAAAREFEQKLAATTKTTP